MKDLRNKILTLLRQNRGQFISGQAVSMQLNISRAAVWKHIHFLRERGYIIHAIPRRGYRLFSVPDLLIPGEIKHGLNTTSFGREIICFKSLDSTNREVYSLAEKGAPEGTVVIAEEQTDGRGRRGRSWHSASQKGLWFSVLLRPVEKSPVEMAPLTAVAAAVIAAGLRKTAGLPVSVKWPNDLFINGRKTGGILAEIKTEPEQVCFVVVGIGLNINHVAADFPPELSATATSFMIEANRCFNRADICRVLLQELEEGYNLFIREGFAPFYDLWKNHNITLGRQVSVRLGNKNVCGLASDIDKEGALIIEGTDKEKHRFTYGEIEHLETAGK